MTREMDVLSSVLLRGRRADIFLMDRHACGPQYTPLWDDAVYDAIKRDLAGLRADIAAARSERRLLPWDVLAGVIGGLGEKYSRAPKFDDDGKMTEPAITPGAIVDACSCILRCHRSYLHRLRRAWDILSALSIGCGDVSFKIDPETVFRCEMLTRHDGAAQLGCKASRKGGVIVAVVTRHLIEAVVAGKVRACPENVAQRPSGTDG